MNTPFENLNTTERFVRFAISITAILVMMESALVGSTLFAVVCLIAIALATTATIGWDPLKLVTWNVTQQSNGSRTIKSEKHA